MDVLMAILFAVVGGLAGGLIGVGGGLLFVPALTIFLGPFDDRRQGPVDVSEDRRAVRLAPERLQARLPVAASRLWVVGHGRSIAR